MSFRRLLQSALFELFDAVRSRRAIVLVILYLALSLLTMGGTITALGKMEDQHREGRGQERHCLGDALEVEVVPEDRPPHGRKHPRLR